MLAVYGEYRIKQVIDFWRYRKFIPEPKGKFAEEDLPLITVQLPLFNEMYVVERLVKAVTEIDYPREKFEIQVLDDSTDETVNLAEATVAKYAQQGFDIHYLHRSDRTGFKAGALEQGLKTAKGELLAIFDADFVQNRWLRKLVDILYRSNSRLAPDALVAQSRSTSADPVADHHARWSFRCRTDHSQSYWRLLQFQRHGRHLAAAGDCVERRLAARHLDRRYGPQLSRAVDGMEICLPA